MSHRLGIEIPDRIAAIGLVVGALFGDEPAPASAVAAIVINGARDESVPPAGGPPEGPFQRSWDGTPVEPAARQAEFWARANGCEAEPGVEEGEAVTRWRYDSPVGAPVERYLVKDQGHAWPGGERGSRLGDEPSRSIDAADLIWEFFREAGT